MSVRRVQRSHYRLRRAVEEAFFLAGVPVQDKHVTNFCLALAPALAAHIRIATEEAVKLMAAWSIDDALEESS